MVDLLIFCYILLYILRLDQLAYVILNSLNSTTINSLTANELKVLNCTVTLLTSIFKISGVKVK